MTADMTLSHAMLKVLLGDKAACRCSRILGKLKKANKSNNLVSKRDYFLLKEDPP